MATTLTIKNLLIKGISEPRWVSLGSLDATSASLVEMRRLLVAKSLMAATDTFLVDGMPVDEADLSDWTIVSATKVESEGKRSIEVKAAAAKPTTDTTPPATDPKPSETPSEPVGAEGGVEDDDDSPTAEDAGDPDIPTGGHTFTPPTRPNLPSVELPSEADETTRLQYFSDLSNKQKRWLFAKVGLYRGLRLLLGNQNLASPGTDIIVVPRTGKAWPNPVPTSPTLAVTATAALTWSYHSFQKDVSHSASLGGSYKMVGLSAKYQRDESHLEIREKTKIYMYGEYLLPKITLIVDKDDLVMAAPVVEKFGRILKRPMSAQRYSELVALLNEQVGPYVPLEIMVGGRLWSEKNSEVTNTDDMDRKVDEFGVKLSVKAKAFSISAGYGYRNEENRVDSSTVSTEDVRLNLVGGDPAKFPEPPKWIGSLGPYKSWAPIKYARLEPTITFLPNDVRNRLLEVMDRFAPFDPGEELVDYRAYIREFMIPDEDDLDDRG